MNIKPIFILIAFLFIITSCGSVRVEDFNGDDSENDTQEQEIVSNKILIVNTSSSGVRYIVDTLEDDGFEVVLREAAEISTGGIEDVFGALIYPGGVDGVYVVLQEEGLKEVIRDFVEEGGGFVGICGGSIVGASLLRYNGVLDLDMIGLLDAIALDYEQWGDRYIGSAVDLQFEIEMEHELLEGYSKGGTIEMTYAAGPIFQEIGSGVSILMTFDEDLDTDLPAYEISGEPAVIFGEYGKGRVILSSPHPEYDIDTRFFLLNAVDWVLE